MAEQLDDGEFWLPSQFLTDDDDFSTSDLGSFETSDFSDLLDFPALSTSPQSTLLGQLPAKESESGDNINGIANAKIGSEMRSITGIGFFDCSNIFNKGRLSSPRQSNRTHRLPPVYSPPHSLPHMRRVLGQLLTPQPQRQNRATENNSNNRPIGLPLAAWPPLSGQAQSQHQAQPMIGMFVTPKRESAGTGVFLPPRIASPAHPKKKSDGNVTKTKSNKSSSRSDSRPGNPNNDEIQLPSEWVY